MTPEFPQCLLRRISCGQSEQGRTATNLHLVTDAAHALGRCPDDDIEMVTSDDDIEMVTSDDDIELVTSDGDGVLGANNNVKISLEPVLSWSLSRVSWSRVESCATFLVNTDTDSNILS